jgi:transcriptional regulator with XRE-family HTH domain
MVQARGASSGLALFAAELQAARAKAGLSQDQLAARINWSASAISMIEGCRRVPRLDLARKLDEVFEMAGTFERLQGNARTTPLPSWFRPWAEVEAVATQLRLFEHAVVPGLFQTEEYARVILAEQPAVQEDELEAMVTARLDRQRVLSRAGGPPLIWAVLDESVLNRAVGGAKVMHEQLVHLGRLCDQPGITIEVVPMTTGAHCGLAGAFAIADVEGAGEIAYLDTVTDGYIAESAPVVARVALTFNTLRSEALPRKASKTMIMKRAGDYDRPE